MVFYEK